eukprot:TRINITY_DN8282_c0_g2_i1.p1 TRINITY_DN8282_c0_g2~~TRINITY_DN8282_c0_g2_i1.p1  ORF type:complete len:252 (-),score=34.45 TRINITY_DN8282_c0_g2_i1:386-1141(-)
MPKRKILASDTDEQGANAGSSAAVAVRKRGSAGSTSARSPHVNILVEPKPAPLFAAVCLEDVDFSRDTEAFAKRFDVLVNVNDTRYLFLVNHSFSMVVVPVPGLWEHTDNPDDRHLYRMKTWWSDLQFSVYQALASIASDLLDRRGTTTIYGLAGKGPFEIAYGKLTLVREFGLRYCPKNHTATWKRCQKDSHSFAGYNAPMPTCHDQILNFVEFAAVEELEAMRAGLESIGWWLWQEPPIDQPASSHEEV